MAEPLQLVQTNTNGSTHIALTTRKIHCRLNYSYRNNRKLIMLFQPCVHIHQALAPLRRSQYPRPTLGSIAWTSCFEHVARVQALSLVQLRLLRKAAKLGLQIKVGKRVPLSRRVVRLLGKEWWQRQQCRHLRCQQPDQGAQLHRRRRMKL